MRPSEIRAAAWAAAALLLLLPLAAGTPFLLHKRRSDASAALHNHGGSRAPAFAHGKGNADREVPGFWDELAYERARTVEEGSALLAEERARRGREMEERRLRAEEGRAKGGAAVGALEAERRRMARRQLVARKTTKRAARKTTRKAVRKTTSRRRKTTSRRRLTTSRRRLTTKRGAGDAVAPRPTTAAPKVTTPPAVVRTTKAPAPPPPPPPAKTTTRPPSPPPPPPPAPPPPPPPSPSAPKSTINPQPTPPPPAAAIATKDAQDPTLPIPPGPLSVLLVSETAFSIGWGTFANGRGVRAYGSRFWDSDSRVTGFAVDCFSAASASDPVPDGRISKAFVTPYRAIQVELTPQEAAASKTWGCTVRTVSASGVGPLGAGMRIGVSLSAGEARVAALRASAARFLDFNAPLSPPDPRSFLVLHSPCADPASTSAYVPASHLLMTSRNLDSPLCPPGSPAAVSVKPLGTLDFSGGAEALVGWETDGVPDWSSSFTVMLVPNPSADRADPGFGTNLPTAAREYDSFSADKSDFLAVHQVAGNLLSLRRKWTSLAERSDLDSLDLGLGVPGMRRAFVLRVSKGSIALSLAGTEVLRAAVPGMDWDRAQVLLQLAGNDTDGPTAVPLHRVSVDNLWWSRSAPAPAPVQGNVLDYPYSTQATYRRVVPGQQLAFAVDINAEPTGAASILLHFSYANFGGKPPMWEWRNALCVLAPGRANGVAMNVYGFVGVRSIPCSSAAAAGAAEQTAGQVAAQFGAPGAWPGTWIVRLDPAWVARGTNVFLFDLLGPVLVGDLHVELTYPAASVPAYAPAAHWLAPFLTASNPEPTAAWLGTGPAAGLARVQGVEVWGNHPLFFRTGLRVNSTVLQVEWEAGTALAGRIRGAEFAQRGVARVELLVAGQVAQRYTYPRPGMGYVYGWADVDLVPLADWSQGGDRRLGIEVRAYDSAGNPWFADYDGVGAYGLPYGTWRGKNVTLGMVAELGQPKAVAGLPVFPPRSDPALPAVGNVQVVEDDRVATLSWDSLGHFTEYGTRFWARKLSGYLVTWYPISNTSAALKIPTAFRATQLQPLVPGVLYGAVVQAIDAGTSAGRLGPPSAEVRFRSNASRVDALRQACSGFFDDMNIGAGQFDPAKWVTSYSLCTDPAASANFVNGQFHGHNAVKTSGRCPSANLSDI
ncbi:hypothetical protein DFJ74DRAFT_518258 [Hyaloraphidium curvatum]|nr:hypothetical protein DFJ74DRAFT_518258 [Hyaloraphidium curvatum]